MAKRTLPPSAFALPGLAKDSKKPFGVSSTREGFGFSSANNVSRTNARSSKLQNLNDSSSLVDGRGSLLPPQTEHTLENLTKTRPRSPGRRTPSPLARRKFEHDSNLFEADNPETSIKDHEDVPTERINSLKERLNASPALILSNDVGLSVSSSELSLSRSSPRMGHKNRANRPEVLPKPDRTRNRENGDFVGEKSVSNATRVLSEPKILSVSEGDRKTIEHDPPPLPASPPPLEDDEILGSLANDTLNDELKHSFQASEFEKTTKAADKTTFDLSTKVGNPIKNPTEVNGLNRPNSRQLRDTTISDTANGNYSSSSRIAKWQGYGRTSSEDNHALGMPKTGAGIPKIGSGIPDRQTSIDSAITSRLSKYETPYNSRQRKPVEKSMSANRRRFKPVTLTDESEKTDSQNTKENLDSSVNVANTNTNQLAYERLHGTQIGKNYPDSSRREHNKEMDVKSQPLSSSWNTREHSFQSNSFMSGDKVKPVPGHSSMPSLTSSASNIDKSRQKPGSPDLHGGSRTTTPEPAVVVEYDSNNYTEKDSDVEGNRKVRSVSSDLRASNKHEFQSNIATSEMKKNNASDIKNDRNSRLVNQHGSPGLTLPKVVIEYDGVVINDPLIDGYDTEETSDEGKKMTSSSIAEAQDSYTAHEVEYMSDGSLHSEDDYIGDYGLYSDEEDVEDITLRDEDLTFDEPAREEVEEKARGMWSFLFVLRMPSLKGFCKARAKRG